MEYRLIFSELLLQRVADLLLEADLHGQGEQAREAIRSLQDLLRTSPQVGEQKYDTPAGHPVHQHLIRPISFCYVIYEEHRIVWVTRVDRLSAPGE